MYNKQKIRKLKQVICKDGRITSTLLDALTPASYISIVGGGGKTHTMFTLARELAQTSHSVMITTTTRILPFEDVLPENVSLVCESVENGKLQGPKDIDSFRSQYDFILVEADGSKGYPVKMPAAHEPVIPEESDQIIAVFGLSGIGKPIAQVCHRPEIICEHRKKKIEECITIDDCVSILLDPQGLRKDVGNRSYTIVLNQADNEEHVSMGKEIMKQLPDDINCIMTTYYEI